MSNEQRKQLDSLLEEFRDNPSNSNKSRHSIYALIDSAVGDALRVAIGAPCDEYEHTPQGEKDCGICQAYRRVASL